VNAPMRFSSDPTEFAGKRALVTGGTKGMGQAIVRRLAAGGAKVATTARSPLPEGMAGILFVQADVSTSEGTEKAAREVQDRLGGLDILVNNVGGSSAPGGGVLALGDDDWQQTINTNLFAAVRLDRAFLPGMLKRASGVIIHISSRRRHGPGGLTIHRPMIRPGLSREIAVLRCVTVGGLFREARLRVLVQTADHVAREKAGLRGDVGIRRLLRAVAGRAQRLL